MLEARATNLNAELRFCNDSSPGLGTDLGLVLDELPRIVHDGTHITQVPVAPLLKHNALRTPIPPPRLHATLGKARLIANEATKAERCCSVDQLLQERAPPNPD